MSPVIKTIRPDGLLDRTKAVEFNQKISNCFPNKENQPGKDEENQPDIVLIDFKDVTFMDSSGLGAVVLAIKTVQSAGREIYVCSMNNQLKMLFELSGLDKVVEIFENAEEFEQQFLPEKSC